MQKGSRGRERIGGGKRTDGEEELDCPRSKVPGEDGDGNCPSSISEDMVSRREMVFALPFHVAPCAAGPLRPTQSPGHLTWVHGVLRVRKGEGGPRGRFGGVGRREVRLEEFRGGWVCAGFGPWGVG